MVYIQLVKLLLSYYLGYHGSSIVFKIDCYDWITHLKSPSVHNCFDTHVSRKIVIHMSLFSQEPPQVILFRTCIRTKIIEYM